MKENNYKLSILIPSWDGEQYIENCINSILENDYENYQIISIAGGTDQGYDISLKLQEKAINKIIALKQEKGGKNKALNQSLEYIDGEIIIITDVDCIYPKHWLNSINEIFQDRKINVITGLNLPYQLLTNSLAEFNRIRVGYTLVNFPDGGIVVGNKLWGGNSAFRKEVFNKKIGKFEEVSKTGDDKILGIEFNRKGEKIYFFRDIYVYTEHYSNNLKFFINHRIRWAKDLFIDIRKKDIPKLLILLGIGLFKFFYPLLAFGVWLFFFQSSLINLLILQSPWIIFYLFYIVRFFFELKIKSKQANKELGTKFSYWKAFKIVPLIFFVFGIISIRSFINPKKRKWFH